MAIPLFGEIEKLINEHGSAVILKERIDLLKEQYAAIEKKHSDSEAANTKISAELRISELSNYELKQKIQELELAGQKSDPQRLEPIRERLLCVLALVTRHVSTGEIAETLEISNQVTLFHLTELESNRLVHGSYTSDGRPPHWAIIQGGRAYLAKYGLLP